MRATPLNLMAFVVGFGPSDVALPDPIERTSTPPDIINPKDLTMNKSILLAAMVAVALTACSEDKKPMAPAPAPAAAPTPAPAPAPAASSDAMKPATDSMKPAGDAMKAADTPVTTDPSKAAADASIADDA